MNENTLNFDCEAWLLPYKPINLEVRNVNDKVESNEAGKKGNEQLDSKNRRILSKVDLFDDKQWQKAENIPGPSNILSSSSNTGSGVPVPTSVPISSTVPISSSVPVSSKVPVPSYIQSTNAPSTTSGPKHSDPNSDQTPSTSHTSNTSSDPGKIPKGKRNYLQRKFERALATPVTISKAESMMLKMGWAGGALGKTGGGITEPIVPNLAYAISTKGFGQLPPPKKLKKVTNPRRNKPSEPVQRAPSPLKFDKHGNVKPSKAEKERIRIEKRQQREHLKSVFKDNVMRYILNFVKNEREIAILFDKTLHIGQRKAIHTLVDAIQNGGELEVQSKKLKGNWDKDRLLHIANNNRYILQTQSEGNPPHRYLCLFKEAPESMYLVTHFKLNDIENDFKVKKEEVVYIHRFSKKKRRRAFFEAQNARKLTGKNCAFDKEQKIVKESIDINPVPEIDVDNTKIDHDENKNDHDSEKDSDSETEIHCESENEQDFETEMEFNKTEEFNDDVETIIVSDEDAIENENSKQITKTDIEEEIKEIVERTAVEACINSKGDEIINIKTKPNTNNLDNISKIELNESVIENIDKCTIKSEETIPSIEDKFNPNTKEIKSDSNDEAVVSISVLKSSRKEFMRYNLNMCFSDFINGSAFKEFKFLGDFDMEEFEVLNAFLKDFFLVINDKEAIDKEFMGIWNAVECKLSFKRDINEGIVIYKV